MPLRSIAPLRMNEGVFRFPSLLAEFQSDLVDVLNYRFSVKTYMRRELIFSQTYQN